MKIAPRSFLAVAPPIAAALALAGCDPMVELDSDASSTSSSPADDDSTTLEPGDSSTTREPEDPTTLGPDDSTTLDPDGSSTTDAVPPDEPEPSLCPEGAGDLALEWTVAEPAHGRGDSVAVGAGRVAWSAGEFLDSRIWVLDADGNPLWEQAVPLVSGTGELAYQDLEVDPDGNVILAGTLNGDGLDALLRWYDVDGNVLAEDVHSTPAFESWQGVARLPDGDVVVAGEGDDAMLVRRYAPDATVVWSQTFSENGASWSSHVAVAPNGTIFVSGHSNVIPGPVLLAYDPDGTLLWSYLDPEGSPVELDVASSVAADGQGRAWLTVISEIGEHRVERFEASGSIDLTLSLDFRPNAIGTDLDGSIVVAGAIVNTNGSDGTIVVERYDSAGTDVARHERPGRFATGVAIDEKCHAYVSGYDNFGGAWLEKLR